jgi:ribosomal protein L37E
MSEIERAIEKKEYIERGALIDYIDAGHLRYATEICFSENDVVSMISKQPAADVEPVVRGEWKWEQPYTICSVCGRHSINRFQSKYCQHCGAKMNNPRGAHMERSGSGE